MLSQPVTDAEQYSPPARKGLDKYREKMNKI